MLLHKNYKLLITKQNKCTLYKKVISCILFPASFITSKRCYNLNWRSSNNNRITVSV
jgi:hypothetical protein